MGDQDPLIIYSNQFSPIQSVPKYLLPPRFQVLENNTAKEDRPLFPGSSHQWGKKPCQQLQKGIRRALIDIRMEYHGAQWGEVPNSAWRIWEDFLEELTLAQVLKNKKAFLETPNVLYRKVVWGRVHFWNLFVNEERDTYISHNNRSNSGNQEGWNEMCPSQKTLTKLLLLTSRRQVDEEWEEKQFQTKNSM